MRYGIVTYFEVYNLRFLLAGSCCSLRSARAPSSPPTSRSITRDGSPP